MNTYPQNYSFDSNLWNSTTYNQWSTNTIPQNIPYPYYFTNNISSNLTCNQNTSADLSFDYHSNSQQLNHFSTPMTTRTIYQQSLNTYSPSYNCYQNVFSLNYNEKPKFLNNSVDSNESSTNLSSIEHSLDTSNRNKRTLDLDNESFCQDVKKRRSDDCLECSICYKQFDSKASLIMHNHIYHNKGSSKQCPLCSKKLHSYSSTIFHLKIHTKEKDYSCEFCRACFTDATALKRHIRTHTGERPYKCGLCHKAFSQSGNLKRHMKIHNQEKLLTRSNDAKNDQANLNQVGYVQGSVYFNDDLYKFLNDL